MIQLFQNRDLLSSLPQPLSVALVVAFTAYSLLSAVLRPNVTFRVNSSSEILDDDVLIELIVFLYPRASQKLSSASMRLMSPWW